MRKNDFNYRTLTIDGQIIRTAIRPGSGHLTPLLICNGIGASLDLVMPFVKQLDPEQEVIAFDVPGVGGSPAPFFPYTFRSLASLLAKVLDRLDYGQVNVIGVSWGGFLAQQFAYSYPERCAKLILAATSSGVASRPPTLKVLALMASPRRYLDAAHAQRIAPHIYGGVFRRDKDKARHHAQQMESSAGSNSLIGYAYQAGAVYFWTSIHWLHKIRQPTLVLAGKDDPLIPLANMKALAGLIPNARLHVFDCGHLFLITLAEEVAPIINSFLNRERLPAKSRVT
jgi:poly(3-hydroxyalkanoate) depolymerase